jgi:hypothetical protein
LKFGILTALFVMVKVMRTRAGVVIWSSQEALNIALASHEERPVGTKLVETALLRIREKSQLFKDRDDPSGWPGSHKSQKYFNTTKERAAKAQDEYTHKWNGDLRAAVLKYYVLLGSETQYGYSTGWH